MEDRMTYCGGLVNNTVVSAIRAYQFVASPLLGKCCRFYPSCSAYCIAAIEKYGCMKGLRLGIMRICKCHPFNPGGVDYP